MTFRKHVRLGSSWPPFRLELKRQGTDKVESKNSRGYETGEPLEFMTINPVTVELWAFATSCF